MRDYIIEQSAGELLRNNFEIYFKNFFPFFLIYFIPVFPFQMMSMHGQLTSDTTLKWTGMIIAFFVSIFTGAAITLAVSDACLSHRPSFVRSYQAVFKRSLWINYVLTMLLVGIIVGIGLIFLIIPGLLFLMWFSFALPVVILEKKSAIQALKR